MAQTSQRSAARSQSRVASRTASARNGDGDRGSGAGQARHPQNDEATIAYIKKILCSQPPASESSSNAPARDVGEAPLEELLPPLTSSNELDVQLYALVAVILSNFVQTWYNRITPDQQFVAEIVQIIAHCTRGLEQRLRKVDLESLVLDEVPDLLAAHVQAIRICKTNANTAAHQLQLRYHALRPHVALEPLPLNVEARAQQQENEIAWCMLLVNRNLPLLLPPEDLQNPCLDVLVSEVFAELIFRNGICGKACEAWLIWDGVAKLLRTLRSGQKTAAPQNATVPLTRLEEFGLLASARSSGPTPREQSRRRFDSVSRTFWTLVQCIWTAWLVLRVSLTALMRANTLPARTARKPAKSRLSSSSDTIDGRADTSATTLLKRPMIGMHAWGCLSEVLSIRQRMPWMSGVLSLVQWVSLHGPGQVCQTNSRLDRLMSFHLHERVLTVRWLPSVLQAARSALFPNNALAPPRKPPTSDEILQIKRECAEAIVEAIPTTVSQRFFATKDPELMREDVEAELLDLLADVYINKHLVVALVELLAVRLFPELAMDADADREPV